MDLLTSKYIDDEHKLLNPYALDIEPADGDRAFVTGYVASKGIDEQNRRISGMASTENVDRYEEIIKAKAYAPWISTFMQNPQFLAQHRMAGFDAAQPTNLGQWTSLSIMEAVGLAGEAQFLEAGDELADGYWTRYRQRAMRAFSVGGIVHEWMMQEFELSPGVKKRLRVITNFELVEISAVTVPANREALVRVASLAVQGKRAGIGPVDMSEVLGELRAIKSQLSPASLAQHINETITKLASDPHGPFADLIQEAIDVGVRLRSPGGEPNGPDADHNKDFESELASAF